MKAEMLQQVLGERRYRIGACLGQGSLGRVFACEDQTRPGVPLALKMVRPDVMSPAAADTLRHEFRVLARLEHPGIVKVHDFGRLPGRAELYFTEDLVDGAPFTRRLNRAPIEIILRCFAKVLRAVGFIHARSVLHCDLKPRNVLIERTEEGRLRVRLLDFHLCRLGDSIRDGAIRGTVAYMAPEVIRGETVDRRADLYGLGAMLFETLARRLPFTGRTAHEQLRAHLEQQPGSLCELRGDISRDLDRLVQRLMAKQPADRFSSAREVLRALHDIDPGCLVETEPTRQAYLRAGALVGRDSELALMRRAVGVVTGRRRTSSRRRARLASLFAGTGTEGLARAAAARLESAGGLMSSLNLSRDSGREVGPPTTDDSAAPELHGRVLQLCGEPGIGKSRLLREARIECQLQGTPFLAARAGGGPVGERFGPFLTILGRLLELLELGSLQTELVGENGRLSGARIHDRHLRRGGTGSPVSAFADLLIELFAARPVIVGIEDFDSADEGSRELALELASRRCRRAVVLIETCERELPEAPGLQVVRPGRLEVTGVRALLRSMLGEEVELDFARRVFEVTGGNPWFIEETLRSFDEDGALTARDGALSLEIGRLFKVSAPEGIRTLLRARAERLEAEDRRLLLALALSLRSRHAAFLATLTGLPRARCEARLEELERRGLVSGRRRARDRDWRVDQAPLRELVPTLFGAEDRARMHGRIARMIESRHPAAFEVEAAGEIHDRSEELAHHFSRAGEGERAREHALKAAELTRTPERRERLLRLYALTASGAVDPSSGRLARLRLGEALLQLGRSEEAAELIEGLLETKATSPWEAATLASRGAELKLRLGELDEAEARVASGRAALGETTEEHLALQTRLDALELECRVWRGDLAALQESLDAERRARIPGAESLAWLTNRLMAEEAADAAVDGAVDDKSDGARGGDSSADDPARGEVVISGLSWAAATLPSRLFGAGDEALPAELRLEDRELETIVERALAGEDRERAALGLTLLAWRHRRRGLIGSALHEFERALMLTEELGHLPASAVLRLNLADLLVELGDFENGELSLALALEAFEHCGCRALAAEGLRLQAILARREGTIGAWQAALGRGLDLFEGCGHVAGRSELRLEALAGAIAFGDSDGAGATVSALESRQAFLTVDQRLRLRLCGLELALAIGVEDGLRQALAVLEPAMAEATSAPDEWLWRADHLMARARARIGEPGRALCHAMTAMERIRAGSEGLAPDLARTLLRDRRRRAVRKTFRRLRRRLDGDKGDKGDKAGTGSIGDESDPSGERRRGHGGTDGGRHREGTREDVLRGLGR